MFGTVRFRGLRDHAPLQVTEPDTESEQDLSSPSKPNFEPESLSDVDSVTSSMRGTDTGRGASASSSDEESIKTLRPGSIVAALGETRSIVPDKKHDANKVINEEY